MMMKILLNVIKEKKKPIQIMFHNGWPELELIINIKVIVLGI